MGSMLMATSTVHAGARCMSRLAGGLAAKGGMAGQQTLHLGQLHTIQVRWGAVGYGVGGRAGGKLACPWVQRCAAPTGSWCRSCLVVRGV
jgi:hypothetical protein